MSKNFKPLYKKFITLRANVQHRSKVLRFKKKKWQKFNHFYSKKRNKWYKKFKLIDIQKYQVSKHPNRFTAYQKKYKNTLQTKQAFTLIYGILRKRVIKNKIKNVQKQTNKRISFLTILENRLDIALYKSKFCQSVREAQQTILHGKIKVNNQIIKNKAYQLQNGDLVSIIPTEIANWIDIRNLTHLPIIPKNFSINYKTMQFVFKRIDKNSNFSSTFPFYLNLESLIFKLPKQ